VRGFLSDGSEPPGLCLRSLFEEVLRPSWAPLGSYRIQFQPHLWIKRPCDSKAKEGFDRGRAKEPGGGAQDTWRTAHGAAAPNMLIAIGSSPSSSISWSDDVIVVPTILGPFRHVAMYLIEAPRIGSKRIDRQ
jgi:hypothetical protein